MGNLWRVGLLTVAVSLGSVFGFQELAAQRGQPFPETQTREFFQRTRQELKVHYIQGGQPGPTLLIIAGIHGDEKASCLTAERYADVKLLKGNLIVVPRLNAPAIKAGKRQGLGGDMNRLFGLSSGSANPDAKVINLAKQLIRQSDYVLNLHQGYDFYNPRWISRQRNPSKWGQSNVIDTATYHLPSGQKLELGQYARQVVHRANRSIPNGNYHFEVNNTNTAVKWSRHREQKGSLTYYSLYNQQKIALGLEATKNCTLAEAVAYLTIAINAAIEEAGIQAEALPSESEPPVGLQQAKVKPPSKIKRKG